MLVVAAARTGRTEVSPTSVEPGVMVPSAVSIDQFGKAERTRRRDF